MTDPRRLTLSQRAFVRTYRWATHLLYHQLAFAYDPISALVSGGRWDIWRSFAIDEVVGPRVLEVGFGTGELLLSLAGLGHDVTGVELSSSMQRVAAKKLARRGCKVSRLRGAAAALPFGSGTFDTIVTTFPSEYILARASLVEFARVLRPGGRLVIAGLNVELPPSWRRPLSLLPGSWVRLWVHFRNLSSGCGLDARVIWREDAPARVPVVVAVRRDAAP